MLLNGKVCSSDWILDTVCTFNIYRVHAKQSNFERIREIRRVHIVRYLLMIVCLRLCRSHALSFVYLSMVLLLFSILYLTFLFSKKNNRSTNFLTWKFFTIAACGDIVAIVVVVVIMVAFLRFRFLSPIYQNELYTYACVACHSQRYSLMGLRLCFPDSLWKFEYRNQIGYNTRCRVPFCLWWGIKITVRCSIFALTVHRAIHTVQSITCKICGWDSKGSGNTTETFT